MGTKSVKLNQVVNSVSTGAGFLPIDAYVSGLVFVGYKALKDCLF